MKHLTCLTVGPKGIQRFLQKELEQLQKESWLTSAQEFLLKNEEVSRLQVQRSEFLDLLALRTYDHAFLEMFRRRTLRTKQDLRSLFSPHLKETILQALHVSPNTKPARSYVLFVKSSTDSSIYRRDIVQAFQVWMKSAFPRWKFSDPAPIEFWGFHDGEQFTLSLRIPEGRSSYRTEERPGSLKPSIAAALALELGAHDCVIDPMCGSGTLLFEHAHVFPSSASYHGWDIDPSAVAIAERNSNRVEGAFEFHSQDFLSEKTSDELLKAAPFAVLSNLPFGKQFSSTAELEALYGELLEKLKQHSTTWQRAVFLTASAQSLRKALARHNLSFHTRDKILVRGTWASVFIVQPRSRH